MRIDEENKQGQQQHIEAIRPWSPKAISTSRFKAASAAAFHRSCSTTTHGAPPHALPMAPSAGGIRACSPDLPSARPKLANSTRRPRAYSAAGALPRLPRPPSIRRGAGAVACVRGSEQQSSPAVAAKARPEPDTLNVEFRTRDGCRLGIARYPDFAYNAQGGRGVGAGRGAKSGEDGTVLVDFDVATLYIPSMSGATTRFLGLPLPPFHWSGKRASPAVLSYLHPRKTSFYLIFISSLFFFFLKSNRRLIPWSS